MGAPDFGGRLLPVIVLLAGFGIGSCKAVPEVGAIVTIVNRSTSPVSVSALEDGQPTTTFPTPFAGCTEGDWGLEYGKYDLTIQSTADSAHVQIDSQHAVTSPPVHTIVIDSAGDIDPNADAWPNTKAPC